MIFAKSKCFHIAETLPLFLGNGVDRSKYVWDESSEAKYTHEESSMEGLNLRDKLRKLPFWIAGGDGILIV